MTYPTQVGSSPSPTSATTHHDHAHTQTAGLPLPSSGRYRIELCDGWTGCPDSPNVPYLGFNNRTCSAGVTTNTYVGTVGPLLRSSRVSKNWSTWTVDVVEELTDRTIVTIKNDFSKAKCTKYYIDGYSEKKDACKGTIWADRVHLHKYPGLWTVAPAKGTEGECFNIVNHEKLEGCLRYLSANSDCEQRHLKVVEKDDGSGLQQWKFVRVGGASLPPAPQPSSAPAPQPSAQPPGATSLSRAPTVGASPLQTSIGYVVLTFPDFGGCTNTKSFAIEFGPVGSSVQSVEVPASSSLETSGVGVTLSMYGQNLITAIGLCSDGSRTARSKVAVVSYVSNNVPNGGAIPLWTLRTSPADINWNSVTWGGPAGSEKFVAVSATGTGNRVMTSPDGVTWTIQTSAADNKWSSVTWGGPAPGLFVTVSITGTGNRVMTSPDGVNWTIRASAADNSWPSVTWGGPSPGLFVAVGYFGTGNRVMTSPDGVNWAIGVSAADNNWRSVTWGGPVGSKKFVAVAYGGTSDRVMTSPDGVTWSIRTSAADNAWFSVTWGGPSPGLFVAVSKSGTGNRVMTSPDGFTWTIRASAADNQWGSVTWGGPAGSEKFVAVSDSGTGNRVMTSPDGINWTTQMSPADNSWNSVTWGGPAGSKKFVAVAYGGTSDRVMTSPS